MADFSRTTHFMSFDRQATAQEATPLHASITCCDLSAFKTSKSSSYNFTGFCLLYTIPRCEYKKYEYNINIANLFKNLGTVDRKVLHIIIGISLAATACKQGKGYKHMTRL
jgi:hypothetical protein